MSFTRRRAEERRFETFKSRFFNFIPRNCLNQVPFTLFSGWNIRNFLVQLTVLIRDPGNRIADSANYNPWISVRHQVHGINCYFTDNKSFNSRKNLSILCAGCSAEMNSASDVCPSPSPRFSDMLVSVDLWSFKVERFRHWFLAALISNCLKSWES